MEKDVKVYADISSSKATIEHLDAQLTGLRGLVNEKFDKTTEKINEGNGKVTQTLNNGLVELRSAISKEAQDRIKADYELEIKIREVDSKIITAEKNAYKGILVSVGSLLTSLAVAAFTFVISKGE